MNTKFILILSCLFILLGCDSGEDPQDPRASGDPGGDTGGDIGGMTSGGRGGTSGVIRDLEQVCATFCASRDQCGFFQEENGDTRSLEECIMDCTTDPPEGADLVGSLALCLDTYVSPDQCEREGLETCVANALVEAQEECDPYGCKCGVSEWNSAGGGYPATCQGAPPCNEDSDCPASPEGNTPSCRDNDDIITNGFHGTCVLPCQMSNVCPDGMVCLGEECTIIVD